MAKGRLFIALGAALLATFAVAASVSAQYPTPQGNLICDTAPGTGGTVTISGRLTDTAGQPISGQTVTFQITEGTGTLSASTATTNAQGVASVTVTGAENTTVNASTGTVGCDAIAEVLGSVFQPPATGDAGLFYSEAGTGERLFLCINAIVMALSGLGFVILRRRRLNAVRNEE